MKPTYSPSRTMITDFTIRPFAVLQTLWGDPVFIYVSDHTRTHIRTHVRMFIPLSLTLTTFTINDKLDPLPIYHQETWKKH